jgi:hypothetical protein
VLSNSALVSTAKNESRSSKIAVEALLTYLAKKIPYTVK